MTAKQRRDAIDEWKEFAAQQHLHGERRDAVIREMQTAIKVLRLALKDV